jgi:hypothetical protein
MQISPLSRHLIHFFIFYPRENVQQLRALQTGDNEFASYWLWGCEVLITLYTQRLIPQQQRHIKTQGALNNASIDITNEV